MTRLGTNQHLVCPDHLHYMTIVLGSPHLQAGRAARKGFSRSLAIAQKSSSDPSMHLFSRDSAEINLSFPCEIYTMHKLPLYLAISGLENKCFIKDNGE